MMKSHNARLTGGVVVDIEDIDVGSYVKNAREAVATEVALPPGYSIAWSGQYEYMERAAARLKLVVPLTIAVIVLLLFLNFRNMTEVFIILGTLPMALAGGIWLLYLLEYNLSVAVGVGLIALAGVAAELGVVMLVYLKLAWREQVSKAEQEGRALDVNDARTAVVNGAVRRVRPILMTVATIFAGLLPIMLGSGTGSEVMQRIAAPMVGGMASATVLTLVMLPAVFLLRVLPALRRSTSSQRTHM